MGSKKAKEAGERARKIQEELIRQKNEAATPPAEQAPEPEATPPVDPAAVAQPVDPPAQPAPATPPVDEMAESWKQRYLTLQGKFNAEVPVLQAKNAALEAQLTKAIMDIENMQATLAAMTPPAAPASAVAADSPELKVLEDQYPEIYRGVKALLDTTVTKAVGDFRPQLEGEVRQIKQDMGATKKTEFFDYLDRHAPDWEQINVRPEWLAWLNEVEPLTGQNRRALLKTAYDALDAKRAAGFFLKFKEGAPASGLPGGQQPPAAPASGDTDIHPASGRGGTPPKPPKPSGDSITRKFIADFYRDKTRGKYKPEEAAAIEKRINLAVSRGDVK